MARKLEDIKNRPMEIESVREWAMEIMQYIFTRSQENLVREMPWGDRKNPSFKRPSRISDTGFLLRSGIPPYWNGADQQIELRYDAPYSMFVEFGVSPHPMSSKYLIRWVNRKLGIKGKKAAGVAFAISRKISIEGMDAHPFLRNSINDAISKYNLQIKGPD